MALCDRLPEAGQQSEQALWGWVNLDGADNVSPEGALS